jgi:hypothetical protein
MNGKENSSSIIEDANSLRNIPVAIGNQLETEGSFVTDNDQVDSFQGFSNTKIDNNERTSQINSNLTEISINKMFELAKADKFPKKIIMIDDVECKFTSI